MIKTLLSYRVLMLLILITITIISSHFTVNAQDNYQEEKLTILKSEPFFLSKEAVDAGIEGDLNVHIKIDKDGRVVNASVKGGPLYPCDSEPLNELKSIWTLAQQNVASIQFKPYMVKGKAQPIEFYMSFPLEKRRDSVVTTSTENAVKDQGVINGLAIKLPKPKYPQSLKPFTTPSRVSVQVIIDIDGNVIKAGTLSGPFAFHDNAREAACKAKFSPTYVDGVAVRATGRITYNFVSRKK